MPTLKITRATYRWFVGLGLVLFSSTAFVGVLFVNLWVDRFRDVPIRVEPNAHGLACRFRSFIITVPADLSLDQRESFNYPELQQGEFRSKAGSRSPIIIRVELSRVLTHPEDWNSVAKRFRAKNLSKERAELSGLSGWRYSFNTRSERGREFLTEAWEARSAHAFVEITGVVNADDASGRHAIESVAESFRLAR